MQRVLRGPGEEEVPQVPGQLQHRDQADDAPGRHPQGGHQVSPAKCSGQLQCLQFKRLLETKKNIPK